MLTRVSLAMVAFGVVIAGCTTTSNAPATAPPTTEISSPTTALPPAPAMTTTTVTTTTVDRVAEIAAIFEDIERRRLQAIFDQNEAAFRALYANTEFLRQSLQLFELVIFLASPANADVTVTHILADSVDCVTAVVVTDLTGITVGGGAAGKQQTLEYTSEGWGISYVGEDWACDGPHPFS